MSSNYLSLKNHQKYMLGHLKDMFNGTFDEDIIESVLEQRSWNMDQALDDLMLMAEDCTFRIPVEDFNSSNYELSQEQSNLNSDYVDTADAQQTIVSSINNDTQLMSKIESINKVKDFEETKNESDDDIIVLNEEEFCLPVESESEEEAVQTSENVEISENGNNVSSKLTYASVAQKQVVSLHDDNSRTKPSVVIYSGHTSYERIKKTRDSLERVRFFVREGFKIMVILRGMPGSGKSHLAKTIVENYCNIKNNYYSYVHSTDNYFHLNETGTYQFKPEKLPEAHRWNQINVLHVAREGLTPIIIDNTNTRIWEMQPYASIAVCAGYELEVVEPDTHWAFNVSHLEKKNVHNVLKNNISKMMKCYDHGISALHLVKVCGLSYDSNSIPPQVGVKELSNAELIDFFDNIYHTLCFFPIPLKKKKKKVKKLTKMEKKSRKVEKKRKRKRAMVTEALASQEDEIVEDIDLSDDLMSNVVKSFVSANSQEDLYLYSDVESEEKSENESDSASELVSDVHKSDIPTNTVEVLSSSGSPTGFYDNINEMFGVTTTDVQCSKKVDDLMTFSDEEANKKNVYNETELCLESNDDINGETFGSSNDLNAEHGISIEKSSDKFSDQLYDELAKVGHRLKCFEMLHSTDDVNRVKHAGTTNIKIYSSVKSNEETTNNLSNKAKSNDENGKIGDLDNISNCNISSAANISLFSDDVSNELLSVDENDIADSWKPSLNLASSKDEIILKEKDNLKKIDSTFGLSAICDDTESLESSEPNTIVKNILNNTLQSVFNTEDTSVPLDTNDVDDILDSAESSLSNSLRLISSDDFIKYASGGSSLSCKRQLFDIDTKSKNKINLDDANSANLTIAWESKTGTENVTSSEEPSDLNHIKSQNCRNDIIDAVNDSLNITEKCCNMPSGSYVNDRNAFAPEEEVKKTDGKLNKIFVKNVNPLNEELAAKTCNIDTQLQTTETDLLQTLLNQDTSYINNLNDDNITITDNLNQILSSSKFCNREIGSSDISSSLIRNVIDNNLWGDGSVPNVKNIFETDKEKSNHVLKLKNRCLSDSENSYYSNSNSSEELRIKDIHNSVNRFVNNDIKCEALKKHNINQYSNNKDKNISAEFNSIDESVDSNASGVESMVPEFNTLKERILINSLDKVLNQSVRNIDNVYENTFNELVNSNSGESSRELKLSNVTNNRKSSCSTFQLLENKLKDNVDKSTEFTVEHNDLKEDDYCNIEINPLEINRTESKLWNQWMRDNNWEDGKEQVKKNTVTCEPKPPRNKESASKQKNCDITNLRLMNDIKNAESCKLPVTLEKNRNKENLSSQKYNKSNFQFMNEWQLGSSLEENFMFSDNSDPKLKKTINFFPNMLLKKSVNQEGNDNEYDKSTVSNIWNYMNPVELKNTYSDSNQDSGLPFKNLDMTEIQFSSNETDNNIQNVWNRPIETTQDSSSEDKFKPKPRRKNSKKVKNLEQKTETLDEMLQRYKNITKNEKINKWSSLNEGVDLGEHVDDSRCVVTCNNNDKKTKNEDTFKSLFIPVEVLNMERNKATMTNTEDLLDFTIKRQIGSCREINEGLDENVLLRYEIKSKCDKSTMTEGNGFTVKVKPLREDLLNMFPREMVDSILDLYEKCNGNMDWIIEILMEDGYSPSDDQLEYLSSLQNVAEYNTPKEPSKNKEKKKNKSNINARNIRRNNSHFNDDTREYRNAKRKKESSNEENAKEKSCRNDDLTDNFQDDYGEDSEESVKLFFDSSTVDQLVEYFGNPTIYSLTAYQSVINLPMSLARQLHAYLIDSVIDQSEKNDFLINQFIEEEEIFMNEFQNTTHDQQFTLTDVKELEKSLTDLINEPNTVSDEPKNYEDVEYDPTRIFRKEDSFAAKVSLDLLFKSFPTIDQTFVKNTFKTKNFSYYDTKNILTDFGKEVHVISADEKGNAMSHSLLEQIKNENLKLFENNLSTVGTRNDALCEADKFRDEAASNFEQCRKYNDELKKAAQAKNYGVAAYYREIMNVFKQKYEQSNARAAAVLFNLCLKNSYVIDLHFFKVMEALRALDIFVDHHISRLISNGGQKTSLYIITGRGARSADRVSHLQPAIKNRLRRRNIFFIEDMRNTGMVKAVVRKKTLLTCDL